MWIFNEDLSPSSTINFISIVKLRSNPFLEATSTKQGTRSHIRYVTSNYQKTYPTQRLPQIVPTWAQFHNQGFTLSVNPNNCLPEFE